LGSWKDILVNEERLRYYLTVKSGQFQKVKIIGKDAHVSVIYSPL